MDDKVKNARGFYITFKVDDSQITLKLLRDDLTIQKTNVIVNAANNKLLFGDGIAGAIYKKAGPPINDECKQIMKNRNNKNLDNGEVIPSSCGNMTNENLIYIFHAVGPYYHGGERNERFELMLTFMSCLNLAEAPEFSVESISIPPISTGLFGYPIYDCAKVFYSCITELIQDKIAKRSKVCLKDIRMVIIDEKTFNPFKDEFDTWLTEISTSLSGNISEYGYIEYGSNNSHILKKLSK